jgi:hypothetical protein
MGLEMKIMNTATTKTTWFKCFNGNKSQTSLKELLAVELLSVEEMHKDKGSHGYGCAGLCSGACLDGCSQVGAAKKKRR